MLSLDWMMRRGPVACSRWTEKEQRLLPKWNTMPYGLLSIVLHYIGKREPFGTRQDITNMLF